MKAFINDTDQVVNDALLGLVTNPQLTLLDSFPEVRVVLRKDWHKKKVSIISGGGSGHEPAHAGFVGKGMLTAAVCGDIFASPSVDAVLSAILATTGKKGCLLIIKNYTGDRLNFGLAAEQARTLGHRVETITVGDDVALGMDVQRRGLAGTVFVQKIAGQLAEEGKGLNKIVEIAQHVADRTYSIGLSLTDCQHFDQEEETRLSDKEAELGLGIHGEPGANVIPFEQADKLMQQAVKKLSAHLPKKGKYALLLNNMGSVSPIEMNVLLQSFSKTALAKQVEYLIGPSAVMSSINMSGFSLSLLLLDKEIEKALLKTAEPTTWQLSQFDIAKKKEKAPKLPKTIPYKASTQKEVKALLEKVSDKLQKIEKEINSLDNKVGDGDAGSTFALAGKMVKESLGQLPLADTGKLLLSIGKLLAREAGGSSGVLLSVLFTTAGNTFGEGKELGEAFLQGLKKMQDLGGAQVGDRTMIDALAPAFEALAQGKDLQEVAKAARKGADGTKKMTKTKFGRSSYLSASNLKNIPDPGAEVVARALEALLD